LDFAEEFVGEQFHCHEYYKASMHLGWQYYSSPGSRVLKWSLSEAVWISSH